MVIIPNEWPHTIVVHTYLLLCRAYELSWLGHVGTRKQFVEGGGYVRIIARGVTSSPKAKKKKKHPLSTRTLRVLSS